MRFTSEQVSGIRLQIELTKRARVFDSTHVGYNKQVEQFFAVARAARLEEEFTYESIIFFCQWYVSGDGATKQRAHTSLPKFLSAWGDFCLANDLPFAYPGTHLRKRINKFIQGLKNRFPHTSKKTVPLCLDVLASVAAQLGFRSAADLYRRSPRTLCQWARIITAHDAFLRPVEHSKGCRLSDFDDHGSFVSLLVGSREEECKYKHGPRTCTLPVQVSHLSAGFVLRVLVSRVHGNVARGDRDDRILFSAFGGTRGDIYQGVAESWGRTAFPQLRRLAAHAGVVVATGRCLRAGGATDFFARQAPRWWIKRQGGWSSKAVDKYNQPSLQQRHAIAAVYSKTIIDAAVAAARSLRN